MGQASPERWTKRARSAEFQGKYEKTTHNSALLIVELRVPVAPLATSTGPSAAPSVRWAKRGPQR